MTQADRERLTSKTDELVELIKAPGGDPGKVPIDLDILESEVFLCETGKQNNSALAG